MFCVKGGRVSDAASICRTSNGSVMASKSRQPWTSTGTAGEVFVCASSAIEATSGSKENNAERSLIRSATSRGALLKPISVTLQNSSACLTQCPAGYKLRANEVPYPRANTALEEVAAVLAMLAFFGFGALLPFIWSGCMVAVLAFRSVPALLFLGLTACDCFLPPGKIWPAFRHCYLMDVLRRHYRMRIITPPQPFMDTSKHHLCVQFPHAVFPMSCFLNPALVGAPGTGMPGPMEGAVASILLQLPFYKHVFGWIGGHAADGPTLRRVLRRTSIGMQPEGIAGVFHGARPAREAVFLRKRHGFIRLAIQAGTDIMPVYHLGDSQLFDFWGFKWLSRKLRASLGVIWGRWGLPLPRQHDLIALVGYPIPVKQSDHPSAAEVDRVHALLVDSLSRMYDEHKHLVPGWVNRPLHII